MKKSIALLLAGAMTLSMLLSACGTQAEGPSPDAADTPSPSAPAEPAATPAPAPTPEPSAEAVVRSAEISEDPAPEESGAQPAAVTSDPPQAAAAPTKAPAVVSTPKPAVSTPAPATPAPAVSTPAPVVEPPVTAAPQPTPEPEPVPTPAPPAPAATKEAAMAYIGRSVSSLIAAIGQPNGRDYAPSCMGDGEDGELFYNGFTVYTYREGNTETVQDVI